MWRFSRLKSTKLTICSIWGLIKNYFHTFLFSKITLPTNRMFYVAQFTKRCYCPMDFWLCMFSIVTFVLPASHSEVSHFGRSIFKCWLKTKKLTGSPTIATTKGFKHFNMWHFGVEHISLKFGWRGGEGEGIHPYHRGLRMSRTNSILAP